MSARRVVVRVEQLRLQGFAPASRERVAGAFRTELNRLLATQVPPGAHRPREVAVLRGSIPERDPVASARSAARSVYRELSE